MEVPQFTIYIASTPGQYTVSIIPRNELNSEVSKNDYKLLPLPFGLFAWDQPLACLKPRVW